MTTIFSLEFIDKDGKNLIVKHDKNTIVLKTDKKNINNDRVEFSFEKDILEEIIQYLIGVSKRLYKDFKPKVADSISSDYEEYYDKKYDSNGYLIIKNNLGILKIERPCEECPYLYKFNKRRMESFIYDYELNK